MTSDASATGWTPTSVELVEDPNCLVPEFLRPADGEDLRTVRLAALRDSPKALVATAAGEESLAPTDWMARIALST